MATQQHPRVVIALPLPAEVLAPLAACCEVDAHDGSVALTLRVARADGLLVGPSDAVTAELIAAAPQLRAVCSLAVGVNNIDLQACRARGIAVTNAPDVLTQTTADFAMALLLAAARGLSAGEADVRAGRWQGWQWPQYQGVDVYGKRLAIVGMGRIGRAIAERAHHGFGMTIAYCNRSRLPAALEAPLGAQWIDLDALLPWADHLMLAVPYSGAVHHLIGAREIARMQPHATLVNIARGGVVDDAALAEALHAGHLAGAALDVFEGEPRVHPRLLTAPRCTLTPHMASASVATRRAMASLAVRNLAALMQGQPALTPVVPVA